MPSTRQRQRGTDSYEVGATSLRAASYRLSPAVVYDKAQGWSAIGRASIYWRVRLPARGAVRPSRKVSAMQFSTRCVATATASSSRRVAKTGGGFNGSRLFYSYPNPGRQGGFLPLFAGAAGRRQVERTSPRSLSPIHLHRVHQLAGKLTDGAEITLTHVVAPFASEPSEATEPKSWKSHPEGRAT